MKIAIGCGVMRLQICFLSTPLENLEICTCGICDKENKKRTLDIYFEYTVCVCVSISIYREFCMSPFYFMKNSKTT